MATPPVSATWLACVASQIALTNDERSSREPGTLILISS